MLRPVAPLMFGSSTSHRGSQDPKILVLTAGGQASASGQRAQLLFSALACQTVYQYRSKNKLRSLFRFLRTAITERPSVIYVVDVVWSSVIATLISKALLGCRFVLDTGDAAHALARSVGRVNRLGCLAVWLVEWAALRRADLVIVRGRYHRLYLRDRGVRNVVEIPDCVTPDGTSDTALDNQARELRKSLGLMDVLTVGVVGTYYWSPRLGTTYGWDLVEAMKFLDRTAVHGVFIGEGDGLEYLRRRISELGLERRFTVLGPIRPENIHKCVRILDVCLSTQTDDLVGWVRTTGKLPLYLVNNRYVLATDVGQASWVLPPQMRLPYEGVVDRGYPRRLATRLEAIARDRSLLEMGAKGREIVKAFFDAQQMRARLATSLGVSVRQAPEQIAQPRWPSTDAEEGASDWNQDGRLREAGPRLVSSNTERTSGMG